MERGEVTFDDVAVYFTEEEWRSLQEEQKSLYKEVMNENYHMVLSLNQPDIITNIELGCDPYITASAMQGSWQGKQLAASDRSVLQEGIANTTGSGSGPPLKRQRRYPRVNPLRWLKKYKKSKIRPQRTSRRSEQSESGPMADHNYVMAPWEGAVCTGSEEEALTLDTEGSSDSLQISPLNIEESFPQTEDWKRTSEGAHSVRTMYRMNKPDLRVTLIISQQPKTAGESTENILRSAMDSTENILRSAMDSTENILRSAMDSTENILGSAMDSTENILGSAMDRGGEMARSAGAWGEVTGSAADRSEEMPGHSRNRGDGVSRGEETPGSAVDRGDFNPERAAGRGEAMPGSAAERGEEVAWRAVDRGDITPDSAVGKGAEMCRSAADRDEEMARTAGDRGDMNPESVAHRGEEILGSAADRGEEMAGSAVDRGEEIPWSTAHRDEGITGTAAHRDKEVPGDEADRGEGTEFLGQDKPRSSGAKRATRTSFPAASPDNTGNRDEDGNTQSCTATISQSLAKATDDLMDAGRSVHPIEKGQEKKGMGSLFEGMKMTPTLRRQKHVTFSETVTMFPIEPEATGNAGDDVKLWSRSPPCLINMNEDTRRSSAAKPKTTDESMLMESQHSKSDAMKSERRNMAVRDTPRRGNQDMKSPTSIKSNKSVKTTEVVGASPACPIDERDLSEPSSSSSSSTRPQSKITITYSSSLKNQESKPNAAQLERKTTTVQDSPEAENQNVKSQSSIKGTKTMKKTKMEESERVLSSVESGGDTAESCLSPGPWLPPKKRDVGTQMDVIHKEEKPQADLEIQITPPHPSNEDQNLVKSYSCSNCGKITHWTRLNEHQKDDIEKSVLHLCRMCSRQRNKPSLQKGSVTQDASPTKCSQLGKAIVPGSPSRKKPHCSLLDDSPNSGPPSKKKQRQEVMSEAETLGTSANHSVQQKKGEESLRISTSHNIQLKKGEEALLQTPTRHNVQQKKGEESLRTSANYNVQPKKGEETLLQTPTRHSVQLKKVEESLRTPTRHKVQRKKGEKESPRTPTRHKVQQKKGVESLRTPTRHKVQQKKGAESLRTPTRHNVQRKKGEKELLKNSANHDVQLKKGEEVLLQTPTSHNIQLKKDDEESRRSTGNHNVQLKKGEEALLQTPTRNTVQQKKGEENSLRTSTSEINRWNKNASQLKTYSARKFPKSSLCSHCKHPGAPEGPKIYLKVKAINGTPAKSPTNVPSTPDLKTSPEKRKMAGSVQEVKLVTDSTPRKRTASPQVQKNVEKHDRCIKCGKRIRRKRQLTTPLTSIQQKKLAQGGSREKIKKSGAKSEAVRRELVKRFPDEPKKKKARKSKDPRPPRGARDKVLCTKCGKRVALHVPSEDGNDENECVVLPRKKRERPLAGMEPFKCKDCDKIFTRHFSLLQHRLIHTGERPYSCQVCGKMFRDGSYLIVHMRSHTKEKPYSCTECGKCFSQNSALHVHLRTHKDERPFQCQDCGKSFTDQSTFRYHQRIHTGEKPYACTYCGKKFTQQPHMKRHEMIHTGERPFGCSQCGKRFVDRPKLRKHELIHLKGKE